MTTELDRETGLIYGVEDLGMRLVESLIRYRGQPAYVAGSEGNTLLLTLTRQNETVRVPLPDAGIDVRPVPLGYVNGNSKCWFVTRKPERRYKQGLTSRSMSITGPEMSMHTSRFLTCVGFAKTVLGEYPDYSNALRSVRRRNGSKAFSRRFALAWDRELGEVMLCHRGKRVGQVQDGRPVLSERNQYLQEELEAAL